jgi:hypothetical protein
MPDAGFNVAPCTRAYSDTLRDCASLAIAIVVVVAIVIGAWDMLAHDSIARYTTPWFLIRYKTSKV